MSSSSVAPAKPLGQVLQDAGKKALGGGLPGMAAMTVQVFSLMWMRTTMNYQYRYGTSTTTALKTLYKEGGIVRFYRGLGPALIQGPLSRFGDTASNAGMLALLDHSEFTRSLPIGVKTMAASATAGLFRIVLLPVDTLKTIMQVEGKNGITALRTKVRAHGFRVFFHGAIASSSATFVGHFPWFFTHNFLNENLPKASSLETKLLRSAFMGFCSSLVSDTSSNSLRVIKVYRQSNPDPVSYPAAVKDIIVKDGVSGLFFRGLGTRLATNALQSMLFTILWKLFEDKYKQHVKNH